MTTTDTLIADYLERLRRATADLPSGTRAELLDDIGAHLADTAGDAPDEAHVRQVIDELGTPEAIAEAARAESGGAAPARPPGNGDLVYDVTAVLVLLLGGFVVPVLGWVAGVVMLWNGPRWTRIEKCWGTLVWPLVIAIPIALLVLARPVSSSIPFWICVAVVLVGFPAAFVQLLRCARRRA